MCRSVNVFVRVSVLQTVRSHEHISTLGDQGVGKTAIVSRFMYDTYDPSYQVRAYVVWRCCVLSCM